MRVKGKCEICGAKVDGEVMRLGLPDEFQLPATLQQRRVDRLAAVGLAIIDPSQPGLTPGGAP